MNRTEAGALLTSISRVDHRTISKQDAQIWADLLDDIAFDDAMDAARAHLRVDNRWLTPALLRERIQTPQRADPAAATLAEAIAVPDTSGDESPEAYIRALRAMNGARPTSAPAGALEGRVVRGEIA